MKRVTVSKNSRDAWNEIILLCSNVKILDRGRLSTLPFWKSPREIANSITEIVLHTIRNISLFWQVIITKIFTSLVEGQHFSCYWALVMIKCVQANNSRSCNVVYSSLLLAMQKATIQASVVTRKASLSYSGPPHETGQSAYLQGLD